MRFWMLIGLATIAAALSGCEWEHYQLELRPDGKGMERTLTVWRERSRSGVVSVVPFPASALEELEKVYGEKPTQEQSQRHHFQGRFNVRMPRDVGGGGTHVVFESPLGGVHAYVERFRGNDDLAGQLQRLEKAANRLTGLLLGWFESQMREDANWPKVRTFLDGEFRRDAHNLALYVWLARTTGRSVEPSTRTTDDEEISRLYGSAMARLVQYLIDHGYFDPEEALGIARDLSWQQDEKPRDRLQQLVARGQKLLAKKCGLEPTQGAASFAFLSDLDGAAESFAGYVKQTQDYEDLRRTRTAEHQNPPEAREVLADIIISDLLHFDLLLG
ncbi:MAG: hypothetical protein ACREHD_31735, partial [Pirellulales bacterium]